MAQLEQRVKAARIAAGVFLVALCGVVGTYGVPSVLSGGVPAALAAVLVLGVVMARRAADSAEEELPAFHYMEFSHADNH